MYGEGEVIKYTMTTLLFFIGMDWLSGIRASKKDDSYGSKYGIDGVFRSFFIILLPAGGHLLDMILGAPSVVFGLLSFGVLYHVIQSMTANAIRAGWGEWVPDWILVKLTNWVKAEIESKFARAEKRKEESGKL
ncbi:MAG TPA: phage holin family protein [Bacillus bacterium]|nr:phage holin family protein [Bacillus sp. (in: firmicutes)]